MNQLITQPAQETTKKSWPKIEFKNGWWLVDSRKMVNGVASGSREKFETKKRAEARAAAILDKTKRYGVEAGTISASLTHDAITAKEILKPFQTTLTEAARFYATHLAKREYSIPLKKALDEWFLFKRSNDKLSKKTITTNEDKAKILEPLHDKLVFDISPANLQELFNASKLSECTKYNTRRILSEFFLWCKTPGREYIQHNPCEFVEVSYTPGEVKILNVEQCGTLLETAKKSRWPDEFVPYVAIGLFMGLRPEAELQPLRWEHVHFNTNEIEVYSTKIKDKRYISITSELSKLLLQHKKQSGLIVSTVNFRKRWDAIKLLAGFDESNPWPNDAMRHSFASYWLSMSKEGVKGFEGGKPRLAEIMENSIRIIDLHYRRAIPKDEAEKFWGLLKTENLKTHQAV